MFISAKWLINLHNTHHSQRHSLLVNRMKLLPNAWSTTLFWNQ